MERKIRVLKPEVVARWIALRNALKDLKEIERMQNAD